MNLSNGAIKDVEIKLTEDYLDNQHMILIHIRDITEFKKIKILE